MYNTGVWCIMWFCYIRTYLQQVKQSEGDEHAELKAELRQDLQELRSKVLAMIEANEGREEIEKLGRHEFILDTEEHQRLLAAEEEVLQKVRTSQHIDNIHTANSLAKLLYV